MRGSVSVKSKLLRLIVTGFGIFWAVAPQLALAQAGSTITAVICAPNTTVTIASPKSDSVVNVPVVAISGSVNQASQLEMYIDGAFDRVIPLSVNQTNFDTDVTLDKGTHSLKFVAISSCAGNDGETTVVVTYETPSEVVGSSGSNVDTEVNQGGVTVTADENSVTAPPPADSGIIQNLFVAPLKNAAEWLNVGTVPGQPASISNMSPVRAVAVGAGLLLTTFGVANVAVQAAAASPIGASLLSSQTLPTRIRYFSIGGRVVGVIMLLGALFI